MKQAALYFRVGMIHMILAHMMGFLGWKYAHMNSVDFLFELGDENRQSMYLIDKGNEIHVWFLMDPRLI